MDTTGPSIQEQFAPQLGCFGCGPSNLRGLGLKSYMKGSQLVASFEPQSHHRAFKGILAGGVIGTLLDCHANWMAAWALMQRDGLDLPPCTVTAEYQLKLVEPTPLQPITLEANVTEIRRRSVIVAAVLGVAGRTTATLTGRFVAVGEQHPAFGQW